MSESTVEFVWFVDFDAVVLLVLVFENVPFACVVAPASATTQRSRTLCPWSAVVFFGPSTILGSGNRERGSCHSCPRECQRGCKDLREGARYQDIAATGRFRI